MTENARKILDKSGTFGALLTHLSIALDCMTHNLLIVKTHALNFYMMGSIWYLIIWQEGNKELKLTSQGSVLGQPLFSLLICDLFLFVEYADILSYADDNTPNDGSENVDVTLEN